MAERILLEVSKDGWTGSLQLSITAKSEDGSGHGYRIAGPKFNGSSTTLLSHELDAHDLEKMEPYLETIGANPTPDQQGEQTR